MSYSAYRTGYCNQESGISDKHPTSHVIERNFLTCTLFESALSVCSPRFVVHLNYNLKNSLYQLYQLKYPHATNV